jgi:DNA-binding NarL/FixJ family response regulator
LISVLIADDHPMVRHGLRALLSTDPEIRIVGEAADGPTAVRLIRELEPDVALVDVTMPGMSGVDVTAAVSAMRTAVVILSMHGDPTVVTEALAAGARGYVLKEAEGEELLVAVRDVAAGEQCVLGSGVTVPKPDGEPEPLTDREREIVGLIASGLTNRAIATRLEISVRTVEAHRANVMRKLQLHSPAELTLYAVRRGLVRPPTP